MQNVIRKPVRLGMELISTSPRFRSLAGQRLCG